jgi:hypothetical protein
LRTSQHNFSNTDQLDDTTVRAEQLRYQPRIQAYEPTPLCHRGQDIWYRHQVRAGTPRMEDHRQDRHSRLRGVLGQRRAQNRWPAVSAQTDNGERRPRARVRCPGRMFAARGPPTVFEKRKPPELRSRFRGHGARTLSTAVGHLARTVEGLQREIRHTHGHLPRTIQNK